MKKQLSEEVIDDVKEIFSDIVIDHAMNPRNAGEMTGADGYGYAVGHCNDAIEIWLKIVDKKVSEARFWTDGCASTIAAGSIVTEILRGQTMVQARGITQGDVLAALHGLPEGHRHCAALAVNAVMEAVKDYLDLQRDPWKKAYKKR